MKNWQTETRRYRDRIARFSEPLERLRSELRPFPSAPLDYRPSERGLLNYQLFLIVVGAHRSANELALSLKYLWETGRFLGASLCVRLLIEVWGSVVYTERQILKKLLQSGDVEAAYGKAEKLLLGSKTPVPLPWIGGGPTKQTPVHVMDFVREADVVSPGTMATYDFLCDASHPSYLQHTYLSFAGAENDNWSNERFATYGHQVLDRSLGAAELATSGIEQSGTEILRAALPVVLADCGRK